MADIEVTISPGATVEAEIIGTGPQGNGLPSGGVAGDILIKNPAVTGGAEWVAPATSAQQDNTRPITSAAVYTEIGNINALLATI